ncbi:MAG: hypothetical protein SFX73_14215, partial [Kofleriaceae bacterium]|nr:hypothetical protein [Kofleriaceae bacterium]
MICRAVPLALFAAAIGCGGDPARVTLTPIEHGDCGRPAGATGVRITAYAPSGEVTRAVPMDETIAIDDFPADTVQIGVEVTIGGGAVGAAGKSVPLA